MFKDAVSWSKIVALFAFGARLGQHCRANNMEDLVEEVALSLADFAKERITPFIQDEGGWVSFELVSLQSVMLTVLILQAQLCVVFPEEEDYETKVWQGLILVGLGLTLATLLMFIRR